MSKGQHDNLKRDMLYHIEDLNQTFETIREYENRLKNNNRETTMYKIENVFTFFICFVLPEYSVRLWLGRFLRTGTRSLLPAAGHLHISTF